MPLALTPSLSQREREKYSSVLSVVTKYFFARRPPMLAEQDPWTAWSSQQADAIAKMTDAWLSGAGAVRDLQLETAQQMRSWQAQAWQRAVEAKDVTDLMTLQAELLSFDGAHAGQYWGRLTDIASRTQLEMLKRSRTDPGLVGEDEATQEVSAAWQQWLALTGPWSSLFVPVAVPNVIE